MPQTFPFHKDSPFFDIIDEAFLQLGKSGVIYRIIKNYDQIIDKNCHEKIVSISKLRHK